MSEEFPLVKIYGDSTRAEVSALIDQLYAAGKTIDYQDSLERTLLHHAISSSVDSYWKVEQILQHNPRVNIRDSQGITPLTAAVRTGKFMLVELLGNRGADPNIYDLRSDGPLLWAAYYGYLDIVVFLVEELGADIEHVYSDQRTALHWAAARHHIPVVRYLFPRTQARFSCDDRGCSTIDYASISAMAMIHQIYLKERFLVCAFFRQRWCHPLLEVQLIREIYRYCHSE